MSETPIFDQLVAEFKERRKFRPTVSLAKTLKPTHCRKTFVVRPLSYLTAETQQPEYLDDTFVFAAVRS